MAKFTKLAPNLSAALSDTNSDILIIRVDLSKSVGTTAKGGNKIAGAPWVKLSDKMEGVGERVGLIFQLIETAEKKAEKKTEKKAEKKVATSKKPVPTSKKNAGKSNVVALKTEKRGRGRPAKVVEVDDADETIDEDEVTSPVIQRGRGRPRKAA